MNDWFWRLPPPSCIQVLFDSPLNLLEMELHNISRAKLANWRCTYADIVRKCIMGIWGLRGYNIDWNFLTGKSKGMWDCHDYLKSNSPFCVEELIGLYGFMSIWVKIIPIVLIQSSFNYSCPWHGLATLLFITVINSLIYYAYYTNFQKELEMIHLCHQVFCLSSICLNIYKAWIQLLTQ